MRKRSWWIPFLGYAVALLFGGALWMLATTSDTALPELPYPMLVLALFEVLSAAVGLPLLLAGVVCIPLWLLYVWKCRAKSRQVLHSPFPAMLVVFFLLVVVELTLSPVLTGIGFGSEGLADTSISGPWLMLQLQPEPTTGQTAKAPGVGQEQDGFVDPFADTDSASKDFVTPSQESDPAKPRFNPEWLGGQLAYSAIYAAGVGALMALVLLLWRQPVKRQVLMYLAVVLAFAVTDPILEREFPQTNYTKAGSLLRGAWCAFLWVVSWGLLRTTRSRKQKGMQTGNTESSATDQAVEPGIVTKKTSGAAIASLICGVASVTLSLLCIGVVFAPAAIALGHVARHKIQKPSSMITGAGMALAGLLLGYISLGFAVLFLAFSDTNELVSAFRDGMHQSEQEHEVSRGQLPQQGTVIRHKNDTLGFSIEIPATWRQSRAALAHAFAPPYVTIQKKQQGIEEGFVPLHHGTFQWLVIQNAGRQKRPLLRSCEGYIRGSQLYDNSYKASSPQKVELAKLKKKCAYFTEELSVNGRTEKGLQVWVPHDDGFFLSLHFRADLQSFEENWEDWWEIANTLQVFGTRVDETTKEE